MRRAVQRLMIAARSVPTELAMGELLGQQRIHSGSAGLQNIQLCDDGLLLHHESVGLVVELGNLLAQLRHLDLSVGQFRRKNRLLRGNDINRGCTGQSTGYDERSLVRNLRFESCLFDEGFIEPRRGCVERGADTGIIQSQQ